MSKPKIDQEVYDRYLDASVALFMEHYSAILTEKISSEENIETTPFPETLDLKCKALIKKEAAKQKRLTLWKHTKRTLKVAAAFAIAVMTMFSTLFISVDAFRVKVMNFYIENKDGHWAISSGTELHSADPNVQTAKFDINDPLKGLIPSDYTLTVISNADSQRITAVYENANKEEICFLSLPGNSILQIDTENADSAKELQVSGFDAILSVKNGTTQIAWSNKAEEKVCSLIADNISETDIVVLAENLVKRLNN